MNWRARRLAAALLVAVGLYAAGSAEARNLPKPDAATSASPVIPGPKRTIAVGAIEASGGFGGGENWDVGNALSSMLTRELAASGQFIVVERTGLDDLLNERELQANKVAGGSGGAKMIAAQYLVVGSVTEFGGASRGSGLSIGGLGLGSGVTGGAGLNRQTGKVRIDLRLLDARTGEVARAFTVSRTASRTGIAVTGNYAGLSSGANTFVKTPLGDAARQALSDAVSEIATALASRDWEGRVVDWDSGMVLINAGSEAGVVPGDRLRVERLGKVLTDPVTGQILSEGRATLGELVIHSTQPKISAGQFVPIDLAYVPQRGDFVVFTAGSQ